MFYSVSPNPFLTMKQMKIMRSERDRNRDRQTDRYRERVGETDGDTEREYYSKMYSAGHSPSKRGVNMKQ